MDNINANKYKYQICQFTNCYNEKGEADMDIVPHHWIIYNHTEKTCEAFYPSPPYTKKVYDSIQNDVKKSKKPLSTWPKWPITLKGGANSYKEAEKRISRLRNEEFAFTTDDGDNAKKADYQMNIYKQEALNEIMLIPNDDSDSNQYTTYDSSTTDSSIVNKKKKIKKTSGKTKSEEKKSFDIEITAAATNKIQKECNSTAGHLQETVNDGLHLMTDEELLRHADKITTEIDQLSQSGSVDASAKATLPLAATKNNVLKQHIQSSKEKSNNKIINFSPESTAILMAITDIKLSIENICTDIHEIKEKVLGKESHKFNEILTKYNVVLPIDSLDEWNVFNQKLIEDEELNNYFGLMMKTNIDKIGNHAVKSISNILKKLMTKSLISNFTAIKKTTNKSIVFKDAPSYEILKNIITRSHRDATGDFITEPTFHVALRSAFNNSKDWGGRPKKSHE